jgi:hypothetical protein
MTFFINFPTDWAGIPPLGARDIIEELATGTGTKLRKAKRRTLEEIFTEQAVEGVRRNASRTFLSLASWDGPLTTADAFSTSRAELGTISLEDHVGGNDPGATEQPLVESFPTASGLVGVRSIRFVTPYENLPTIVGIVEYAFEDDDQVLRLVTSQLDLENFRATIELMDGLAGSVTSE